MEEKPVLMTAKEVAQALNCKLSRAYSIIREMNKELEAKHKLVLRGQINRKYFYEKIEV